MDALKLLTNRRSSKKLKPPPRCGGVGTNISGGNPSSRSRQYAPFRFIVIQGEVGLQRFRDVLKQTVAELNFGDDAMKKAEKVGNMSPMVIGVTFAPNRDVPKPKPEWEQMLTAGCAAYALQLAATAQGFDNVRITGMWVNSPCCVRLSDVRIRIKSSG